MWPTASCTKSIHGLLQRFHVTGVDIRQLLHVFSNALPDNVSRNYVVIPRILGSASMTEPTVAARISARTARASENDATTSTGNDK
jgi:hypothetical protein